jgi:hypothetical protein
MSILKNIKSLFIEETIDPNAEATEDTAQEPKPESKPQPQSTNPAATTVNYSNAYNASANLNTTPNTSSSLGGTMDAVVLDSLMQALEANNQQGFDFLEFKNAVKALQNLPMDDATKFRSAFATAATMGVTVEALLQSSAFYKSVLEQEKGSFEQELMNQVEMNIKAKERELEQVNADIIAKSEQIKLLTEQITAQQQQSTELKKGLIDVMDKIEITKKNFEATFRMVTQQIDDDVAKINTYLK